MRHPTSDWLHWLPDLVIFWRFLKMKSWSNFSTLAGWICLLHSMIVLIVLNHLTTTNYLAGWHNYAKCVKKFKISVFDQFFDFCGLNMLDIVDFDSTKCSLIVILSRSILNSLSSSAGPLLACLFFFSFFGNFFFLNFCFRELFLLLFFGTFFLKAT